MRLGYHGGLCCGIKTIYEMGIPEGMDFEIEAQDQKDLDQCGEAFNTDDDPFFCDAAPAETNLQRLDRYLAYLKRYRPRGIVEVCLATEPRNPDSYYSQSYWFKPLEERGFKKVTEAKNSNSGNIIHIFHLVMNYKDDDWEKDEKEKEE